MKVEINGTEREIYERHALEAFLGDFAGEYDVEGIESEVVERVNGKEVWVDMPSEHLIAICEGHRLDDVV